MDIFVIKRDCAKNVDRALLETFQNKKISNENKKITHCLSYLMVDRILKEFYQIQNREIEFINEKPVLISGEKCFSISHSGEYIALSFSDNNCGVDIEKIKPVDFLSISKRMKFKSKSLEEFFADWTKYEAVYKLGGKYKSIEQYTIDGYAVCAVSDSKDEKFQIYIQNGEDFSNLKS